MGKVVIDESLRAKLSDLSQQFEFCDPAGQTLGRFVPEAIYRQMLFAAADSPIAEEELQRRRQEPRGRTWAEIAKGLGQT